MTYGMLLPGQDQESQPEALVKLFVPVLVYKGLPTNLKICNSEGEAFEWLAENWSEVYEGGQVILSSVPQSKLAKALDADSPAITCLECEFSNKDPAGGVEHHVMTGHTLSGWPRRCLVCGEEFRGSEEEHFQIDKEHRRRVIQFEEWDWSSRTWQEAE